MKNLGILLVTILIMTLAGNPSNAQTMGQYSSMPPIAAEGTKPNVMIAISNDHTGFNRGFATGYDNSLDYYGYFDANKEYSYSGSYFIPVGYTVNHYTSSNTNWSGNFLNWATMSHADFLRKALTGGRRSADTVSDGGTRLIRADVSPHPFTQSYTGSDRAQLVPAAYANTSYGLYSNGTTMTVNGDTFTVEVQTCLSSLIDAASCVEYPAGNWKPAGLLQKYADKMDFGLMTYSHLRADQGGVLRRQLGPITDDFAVNNGQENTAADNMITYINSYTQKGWDPLAEMYYEALRYFSGETMATNDYGINNLQSDDGATVLGHKNSLPWIDDSSAQVREHDPVKSTCQKHNIVIINDEYPSRDSDSLPGNRMNPSWSPQPTNIYSGFNVSEWTDRVGAAEGINGTSRITANVLGGSADNNCNVKAIDLLSNVHGICPSETTSQGSFNLAGLSYYAMSQDIRPDIVGDQHLRTYNIAFRAASGTYAVPPAPMNQMWLAAKYGNFDDRNGNSYPDLDEEWMENVAACKTAATAAGLTGTAYRTYMDDDSCLPKGFTYAEKGSEIADALTRILDDVLKRAASGTSVSVLSTSGQGEGNLVQAYYRPAVTTAAEDIMWTGYLQSLFVDTRGFLREDTNGNHTLDEDADKIVKYFNDTDFNTRVKRFSVSSTNQFPDTSTTTPEAVIEMGEVKTVWEGGKALAARSASSRKIFTFIDKDQNLVPADNSIDNAGEVVEFTTTNLAVIQPYLGLANLATTGYLGDTQAKRTKNLIQFIRGNDPAAGLNPSAFDDPTLIQLRNRVIDGQVWKLGDIIRSTPVAVSAPPDNYGQLYGDSSYEAYLNKYRNRETVIYVGGNDGMLHAFTSWQYNKSTRAFDQPSASVSGEIIGDELWGYIPQNLLPHLQWLSRRDYSHVFYMDLQPRIFDARVFANDAVHPNGWGTVLVVGMNMGGGSINVTDDFDYDNTTADQIRNFSPSYVALDVTDPRNPKLMWERSYADLGFTQSIPAVLRVGNNKSNGTNWNSHSSLGTGSRGSATMGYWSLVFGSGPDDYLGNSSRNGHVYVVSLATGEPYKNGTNDWLFETSEGRAFLGSAATIDKSLNYNVDAAYIGLTTDTSSSAIPALNWAGGIYKVTIPWLGDLSTTTGKASYGNTTTAAFQNNPIATTKPWTLTKMYTSARPITAPPSLSVDKFENVLVFAGTGRFYSLGTDSDQDSLDIERLYGIKDPFFNKAHLVDPPTSTADYYMNYGHNLTLDLNDLFDANPYEVVSTGKVFTLSGTTFTPYGSFDKLLTAARAEDGWSRDMVVETTAAERSLTKPAIIGGISLFTTFTPLGDECSFGGESHLYALYFETGTAFKKPIIGVETMSIDGETQDRNRYRDDLGSGSTSSVGLHVVGDEVTGYVQQGTGDVVEIDLDPALSIKSGIRSWRQLYD